MNSSQFPRPPSVSSSSSLSSSGLPFSNLVHTIERAIGRWARRGGTDGDSSSSSSSSRSSRSSASSRSPTRRRGRRGAPSIQSYTTSLMTRRHLRDASRIVPREFVLFLPPGRTTAPSSAFDGATSSNEQDRILRTASLKLVLAQLGTALKQNAKTQRPPRAAAVSLPPATGKRSNTTSDVPRVAFDVDPGTAYPRDRGSAINHKKAKGKLWEAPRQIFWQEQTHAAGGVSGSQPAWWLDVASPTWDDMRSLGKVSSPMILRSVIDTVLDSFCTSIHSHSKISYKKNSERSSSCSQDSGTTLWSSGRLSERRQTLPPIYLMTDPRLARQRSMKPWTWSRPQTSILWFSRKASAHFISRTYPLIQRR